MADMGDRYPSRSPTWQRRHRRDHWYAVQVNANDSHDRRDPTVVHGDDPAARRQRNAGPGARDLRPDRGGVPGARRRVIGGHRRSCRGSTAARHRCMLRSRRNRLKTGGAAWGCDPADEGRRSRRPRSFTGAGDQVIFEAAFDHCADFLPARHQRRTGRADRGRGAAMAMHDPTEGGVVTALWELVVVRARRRCGPVRRGGPGSLRRKLAARSASIRRRRSRPGRCC